VAVPTVPPAETKPPTRSQQRRLDKQAARQARFDEVAALHARGWSHSAIARTTGLDRGTIGSWLHAGRVPSWSQPASGSAIDAHADYLRQRWSEGCTNATRLWREIRERGYAGRPKTVQEWVRHRLRRLDPAPAGSALSTPAWKAPSGRRAAWLVVAEAGELDDTERKFVDALITGAPPLVPVITLARAFRALVREKQADKLDDWLTAAQATALAGFVGGLKRDLAAVRAGLSLPWSTGPVEGQISRLKTIKRTMCGRAGFDLLRHRVLEAA
jgi:transposase